MNISIAEAKAKFSELVKRAEARRGDHRHAARQDGGASDAAERQA